MADRRKSGPFLKIADHLFQRHFSAFHVSDDFFQAHHSLFKGKSFKFLDFCLIYCHDKLPLL